MEEIILLELSKQIRDQGYDATPDLPNLMIRIGDKMRIELDPIPITPDIHKSVLPMHIGTYLEDGFFPQGILDNIAGFGDTDEEKIDSFIENYLLSKNVLPTIFLRTLRNFPLLCAISTHLHRGELCR